MFFEFGVDCRFEDAEGGRGFVEALEFYPGSH